MNEEDVREEAAGLIMAHPMLETLKYCNQLESNIDTSHSVALSIPRKVIKELTHLDLSLSILQRRSRRSTECCRSHSDLQASFTSLCRTHEPLVYRLFHGLPKDDSSTALNEANGEPVRLPLASLVAHCYTLPRLAEFMSLLSPKGYKPPATSTSAMSTSTSNTSATITTCRAMHRTKSSVLHKLLILTALPSLPHAAWLDPFVPQVLGVTTLLLKHPNPLVPVFALQTMTHLLTVISTERPPTLPTASSASTLTSETLKLITVASRHTSETVTRGAVELMQGLLQRQDTCLGPVDDDSTSHDMSRQSQRLAASNCIDALISTSLKHLYTSEWSSNDATPRHRRTTRQHAHFLGQALATQLALTQRMQQGDVLGTTSTAMSHNPTSVSASSTSGPATTVEEDTTQASGSMAPSPPKPLSKSTLASTPPKVKLTTKVTLALQSATSSQRRRTVPFNGTTLALALDYLVRQVLRLKRRPAATKKEEETSRRTTIWESLTKAEGGLAVTSKASSSLSLSLASVQFFSWATASLFSHRPSNSPHSSSSSSSHKDTAEAVAFQCFSGLETLLTLVAIPRVTRTIVACLVTTMETIVASISFDTQRQVLAWFITETAAKSSSFVSPSPIPSSTPCRSQGVRLHLLTSLLRQLGHAAGHATFETCATLGHAALGASTQAERHAGRTLLLTLATEFSNAGYREVTETLLAMCTSQLLEWESLQRVQRVARVPETTTRTLSGVVTLADEQRRAWQCRLLGITGTFVSPRAI